MSNGRFRASHGRNAAGAGTQTIVATLESVFARDPSHPGANHYYVHAVEKLMEAITFACFN